MLPNGTYFIAIQSFTNSDQRWLAETDAPRQRSSASLIDEEKFTRSISDVNDLIAAAHSSRSISRRTRPQSKSATRKAEGSRWGSQARWSDTRQLERLPSCESGRPLITRPAKATCGLLCRTRLIPSSLKGPSPGKAVTGNPRLDTLALTRCSRLRVSAVTDREAVPLRPHARMRDEPTGGRGTPRSRDRACPQSQRTWLGEAPNRTKCRLP